MAYVVLWVKADEMINIFGRPDNIITMITPPSCRRCINPFSSNILPDAQYLFMNKLGFLSGTGRIRHTLNACFLQK